MTASNTLKSFFPSCTVFVSLDFDFCFVSWLWELCALNVSQKCRYGMRALKMSVYNIIWQHCFRSGKKFPKFVSQFLSNHIFVLFEKEPFVLSSPKYCAFVIRIINKLNSITNAMYREFWMAVFFKRNYWKLESATDTYWIRIDTNMM